jgi:hypothetical protein
MHAIARHDVLQGCAVPSRALVYLEDYQLNEPAFIILAHKRASTYGTTLWCTPIADARLRTLVAVVFLVAIALLRASNPMRGEIMTLRVSASMIVRSIVVIE